MAENNPFELSGRRGGPAPPHAARTWTLEEQVEKLKGYVEVSPVYWDQVRYGTHVRYYTKKDGFRTGGFVLKNPLDTKGQDKRFMKLQNGFSEKAHGYQQWVVSYSDLDKVYVKPDAAVLMLTQDLEAGVRTLNENIRKVAEHTKKLEARIAALERK